jgi:hypothetical protein
MYQFDGVVDHLPWALARVCVGLLIIFLQGHSLLLLLVLDHVFQSLQLTLLRILAFLLLLALLLELLQHLLLLFVKFDILLIAFNEIDHLDIAVHLTVETLPFRIIVVAILLIINTLQLIILVEGNILLVFIAALCSLFIVLTLVVNTVVKIGVVVDLILLIDIAHPWPELDDSPRLNQGLHAVGEHEVGTLAICIQVTFCRVERSENYTLCLTVLKHAVLSCIEHVLGEEIF